MAWRETFLRLVGPGLLGGLTFGRWLTLLKENHFAVAPSCLPRALAISCQSAQNSLLHWMDSRKLRGKLDNVDVPPPIFVLGHWRNGTTYLHNLLAVDDRFVFPSNYECMFPLTFLSGERLQTRLLYFFLPARRPMDNVEWTMSSPQEDEFAYCVRTSLSPCAAWAFPQRRDHYDKYLTFRGVSESEIREWQSAVLMFVKKLTWKHNRPLILKSPPHTCRIKLLLELFPEAKFVHICRDPFTVFSSSKHTFQVNFEWHRLQRLPSRDLDDWILSQYRRMYEVFFEERCLIPPGHFHEVRYEDLEQDSIGQVQRIYESLNLPPFDHVQGRLQTYVNSLAGYQKTRHSDLPPELRHRIAQEWEPFFDEWAYPI